MPNFLKKITSNLRRRDIMPEQEPIARSVSTEPFPEINLPAPVDQHRNQMSPSEIGMQNRERSDARGHDREASPSSNPAGIDARDRRDDQQRFDDMVLAHHKKCEEDMKLALERPMSYDEFRQGLERQYTIAVIDEYFLVLREHWDTLKKLMFLYVMLDPEMMMLGYLVTCWAREPITETLRTIFNELPYQSPITTAEIRDFAYELNQFLFVRGGKHRYIYLLPQVAYKYTLIREGPLPPVETKSLKANRLWRELRLIVDAGNIPVRDLTQRISELDEVLSTLSQQERRVYKLRRESITVPKDGPEDRETKEKFMSWRKTRAAYGLLSKFGTEDEVKEIERDLKANPQHKVVWGTNEDEDTGETPAKALARLNGYI